MKQEERKHAQAARRPVERRIVRIIHRLSETERDNVLHRFNSAIWQHIPLTKEETEFLKSVVSEHGDSDLICPLLSGPESLLFWLTKEFGNG
ncbi:MAG: hypothetical protein O2931_14680, partial [Planctomycetota bacterium]|nr:hypothetical protein [Planctomycetota bacterium]